MSELEFVNDLVAYGAVLASNDATKFLELSTRLNQVRFSLQEGCLELTRSVVEAYCARGNPPQAAQSTTAYPTPRSVHDTSVGSSSSDLSDTSSQNGLAHQAVDGSLPFDASLEGLNIDDDFIAQYFPPAPFPGPDLQGTIGQPAGVQPVRVDDLQTDRQQQTWHQDLTPRATMSGGSQQIPRVPLGLRPSDDDELLKTPMAARDGIALFNYLEMHLANWAEPGFKKAWDSLRQLLIANQKLEAERFHQSRRGPFDHLEHRGLGIPKDFGIPQDLPIRKILADGEAGPSRSYQNPRDQLLHLRHGSGEDLGNAKDLDDGDPGPSRSPNFRGIALLAASATQLELPNRISHKDYYQRWLKGKTRYCLRAAVKLLNEVTSRSVVGDQMLAAAPARPTPNDCLRAQEYHKAPSREKINVILWSSAPASWESMVAGIFEYLGPQESLESPGNPDTQSSSDWVLRRMRPLSGAGYPEPFYSPRNEWDITFTMEEKKKILLKVPATKCPHEECCHHRCRYNPTKAFGLTIDRLGSTWFPQGRRSRLFMLALAHGPVPNWREGMLSNAFSMRSSGGTSKSLPSETSSDASEASGSASGSASGRKSQKHPRPSDPSESGDEEESRPSRVRRLGNGNDPVDGQAAGWERSFESDSDSDESDLPYEDNSQDAFGPTCAANERCAAWREEVVISSPDDDSMRPEEGDTFPALHALTKDNEYDLQKGLVASIRFDRLCISDRGMV